MAAKIEQRGWVKVQRVGRYEEDGPKYARIRYQKRDDGWYINKGNGMERFALPSAGPRDVRQLINKAFCLTYNSDPEPLGPGIEVK